MPLTALDQGLDSEHRPNGGTQPLGPVDDAEEAGLQPQSSLYQCPQERRTHSTLSRTTFPSSVRKYVYVRVLRFISRHAADSTTISHLTLGVF
jgi:hypothetical protein